MHRLTWLLLLTSLGWSQLPLITQESADSLSYAYFMADDSRSLNTLAETCIAQGIDFYYLDLRTGILLYNHGRMESAIPWFARGLEKYPADTLCMEYMYYSLLNTGRNIQARQYAAGLPPSVQHRIGFNPMALREIGFMHGEYLTTNINDHADDEIRGDSLKLGDAVYNGSLRQELFWMQHQFRNGFVLNSLFTLYSVQSLGVVQTIGEKVEQEFRNPQSQLTIGGTWMPSHKLSCSVAAAWYANRWSKLSFFHDPIRNRPVFVPFDSTMHTFSGTISAALRMRNIAPSITVSVSGFNGAPQLSTEGGMVWYPLGSTRLYVMSSLAILYEQDQLSLIQHYKAGGALWPGLWLEGGVLSGALYHYIGDGGFTAYNANDPLTFRAYARIRGFFGRMEVSPGYAFLRRTATTTWYTAPDKPVNQHYTYFNNTFNLLISWKF